MAHALLDIYEDASSSQTAVGVAPPQMHMTGRIMRKSAYASEAADEFESLNFGTLNFGTLAC